MLLLVISDTYPYAELDTKTEVLCKIYKNN